MIVLAWVTLVVLASVWTLIWLVVEREESTQVTAGLGFTFWSTAALGARDLKAVSGGATVDVSSDLLAVVTLLPATLSALVVVAAHTGHYPPDETETPDRETPFGGD